MFVSQGDIFNGRGYSIVVYNMTPHTVTLFNKYYEGRNAKYKRTVLDFCKFTPKRMVTLGNVQVSENDTGKLLVYERDLNMTDYVLPKSYEGVGFTFDTESIVVIGRIETDINSIKDLEDYEHYTVASVLHNNYSFALPHHFSLEVK